MSLLDSPHAAAALSGGRTDDLMGQPLGKIVPV
jgi:hypothetical protein